MIRRAGRILSSRPARKFRRNRLAMVALGVISLYFAVGIACFVGIVTRDDVGARVCPDSMLGWLEQDTNEHRLLHCKFFRERLETAIRRADAPTALREAALAERVPVDIPVAEMQKLLKEADDLEGEVGDLFDRNDDARIRINNAQAAGLPVPLPGKTDADYDPESKPIMDRAALAASESQAQARLAELESEMLRLWPIPEGWNGAVYHVRTFAGADRQGRSIFIRSLYSVRVALQVGLIVGFAAVAFGTLLGAAAGFYGGWVDHAVTWLYTTFSSIPELVMLSLLAYVFMGMRLPDELIPVYAALALTFWIGPCRVIRGEVLKIKQLEYVQAATAIGFGRFYILLRHVIPNTAHLMLINFSLLFIAAIKAEVILTYLGLGVKNGASWGIMIDQSRQEVNNGNFWQIGVATAFMFLLVLAFNIVSDALQDAFDPKHVG